MAMAQAIPTQTPPVRPQSRPMPAGVDIKVRRMKFDYPEDKKDWADNNPVFSRFMEALSMLFPEGERFFVESVNHYKEQIVDPVLKKQVAAFAAQEGMHSTEHHKYNIRAAGELSADLEKVAGWLREPFARKALNHKNRLAVTVALEHFTAILADELLRDRTYANLMDPEHAKLWLWHAVEETEHKAVAFDVYQAVDGSYVRRVVIMQVTTFLFFLAAVGLLSRLLRKDGRIPRLAQATRFLNLAFGSPGFFRKVFPAWLEFFRPSFHPWQKDNSDLIAQWKAEYAGAS